MSSLGVPTGRRAGRARPAREAALSRQESKAITRRRLLEAALEIVDEDGEAALTTTRVTRLAGVAQSSFYVHFADMDDLLHNLIDDLVAESRRQTREARTVSRARRLEPESFRDTFRVPIRHAAAHPRFYRLLVRARHEPGSLVGEWSRAVHEDNRRALVDDLAASGLPNRTPAEQRRAEMVADALLGMTESLTLSYLDGRFSDVEEVVDVLEVFSLGYFTLYRPDLEPGQVVTIAAKKLRRQQRLREEPVAERGRQRGAGRPGNGR